MAGNKLWLQIKIIVLSLVVVAVPVFFFVAVSNFEKDFGEEGRLQLETSIRRACASAYAIEGFYPPTLEYIGDNYGVIIDEDKYVVFYEVFSDNIMPQISVMELNR